MIALLILIPKTIKSFNKPVFNKNNNNKLAFSKNNNSRLVFGKNNNNSKINRFDISSNNVEYTKKSWKSKTGKLFKFQNLFKSRKKPKK